jgi:hypothetical protein
MMRVALILAGSTAILGAARAQEVYLNPDAGCIGTQQSEAASVKYRVSNLNWDQVISTSSGTTYGTIVEQANPGNNVSLNSAVWRFTLDFKTGIGYAFTLKHLSGGSPVDSSTVMWDSLFCYQTNPCVSPLRRLNAFSLYVKASAQTGLLHSMITADSMSFSGAGLTTNGSLRTLTAEFSSSGGNQYPNFDVQYVRADTNLALFDWTLTGLVTASFDPGYTGQLDERLKFNIDMIEVSGLAPPQLLSPSEGATCQATTGILDWSDVAGAAGYMAQIGTSCGSGTETEVPGSEMAYADLPPGTTLFWRVKTKDVCGIWGPYSECFSFSTLPLLPGAPSLISPTDGSMCQSASGTLDWSDVPGATAYMLKFGKSDQIPTETEVTESQAAYADLLASTTYYWRVKTKDACGRWGNYADSFSFTTAPRSLPAPVLISPPDGAIDEISPVILDWSGVSGTTGYMYQIGTSPDTGPEAEVLFSQSSPLDLEQGMTYHWRVKTKNLCGQWGNYSSCFSFATQDIAGIGGHPLITESKITVLQPNPSQGRVRIDYQVVQAGSVRIDIYDVCGRLMQVLDEGSRERGTYSAVWNGMDGRGRAASSGVYFVRLIAGSKTPEKRLLIAR